MPTNYPSQPLPNPRRPRNYATLRAITSLANGSTVSNGFSGETGPGAIVINFPTMPDVVELVRRSNYTNNSVGPVTPDGLHLYTSTDPLQIPVSFSLNAFDDEYCTPQHGPLILLSIAAKLHALTLPILSINQGNQNPQAGAVHTNTSDAAIRGASASIAEAPPNGSAYFPPACALQILMAQLGPNNGSSNDGIRSLGINCVGFVTDVRVALKGPWLQGSYGDGNLSNLPSEAEFSFTFVHQPGYSNIPANNRFLNASALDVYNRLYNTFDLEPNSSDSGINAINAELNAVINAASTATQPAPVLDPNSPFLP